MTEIGKLTNQEKYKKLLEILGLKVGDFVRIQCTDEDGLDVYEFYRVIYKEPDDIYKKWYYLMQASSKQYLKDIAVLLSVEYDIINNVTQNLASCTCDDIYCTDCPFYYIVKGEYGNGCWLENIGGNMGHKCNMYIQHAIQSPYAKFMNYNKLRGIFRITQMKFDEDCFKFKPYNLKDEFLSEEEDKDAKEKD